jgi:serine protease Do
MKPRLTASLSTLLGFVFVLGTPSALCWGQVPTEAEALSASFRKASRKVLPAVVTVRATGAVEVDVDLRGLPIPNFVPLPGGRGFSGRFGMPGAGAGSTPADGGGSGVVIDADKGYILTNDHLVAGASTVRVVLHDGRERAATQIRHDVRSDLALLVVDPKGLTQAAWGDSEAIDTGDWVLAIGQPFGLADTVTAGIVSGKGRGLGGTSYEDLIQTDAAINHGNSGGPLVNLKGEVVGINTAIRTSRGSYEGIGFAVPASRAKRVAADLAAHGSVRRSYLGVSIGSAAPAVTERLERPGAVVINDVSPGSPAEKAALKRGDVILTLAGKPVLGVGALQSAIEFAPVGEPLVLTVDREGATVELKVVPEALPAGAPPASAPPAVERPVAEPGGLGAAPLFFPELGLRVAEINPELIRLHRLREGTNGLVVVGVDPDGPAEKGGVEIGMVILDAAGLRVSHLPDFRRALAARPGDRDLLLRVLRAGKPEFRVVFDRTDPAKAGEATPPSTTKPLE